MRCWPWWLRGWGGGLPSILGWRGRQSAESRTAAAGRERSRQCHICRTRRPDQLEESIERVWTNHRPVSLPHTRWWAGRRWPWGAGPGQGAVQGYEGQVTRLRPVLGVNLTKRCSKWELLLHAPRCSELQSSLTCSVNQSLPITARAASWINASKYSAA